MIPCGQMSEFEDLGLILGASLEFVGSKIRPLNRLSKMDVEIYAEEVMKIDAKLL